MAVVIGASSIWHAMHAALVDRLMDLALCNVDAAETDAYVCVHSQSAAPPTSTGPVPPLPTVERRLLSTMLQFAVAQFGTAITPADSTHAASTNSLGHSIHSKAPTRATKQPRPLSDSDILRPRQHSFHAHTFASAARAAKTPSMISKHKSGFDSNSNSNLVAPNSAGSSSARLQAANAFLAALQYSAFLESSHLSKSVARAREIRLLNFISFTALCKQLDSEKLRLLFGLEAAVLDSSRSHESLLISDTIQDSLLSLVDIIVDLENKHDTNHSLLSTTDSFHSLADENGGGEPIMRSETVLFQIAWRAHLAWMDLIVIIVSATEQAGLSGILFAESLVKGIFKGLAQLEKRFNTASSAQLKMVLAVYADTCTLLSRTITCLPLLANPLPTHPKHPGVKLLAHPLVLLKHIVNPILRLLLWHDPSCKLHVIQKDSCSCIRAFATTVLKDIVAQIRSACDKTASIYASKTRGEAGANVSKNGVHQHVKKVGWKDVSAGAAAIRGVKSQSARDQKAGPPWIIAEAVECTAFVSEFVEIAAEWSETRVCFAKGSRIALFKSYQNNQSEEAVQPLLDSQSVAQFVQWTLHARPFSTRLAQMFLIPFVEQIAGIGGEENWKACADVIIGVYNGRLAKEKSSGIDSDGPSTINYITKWLVMTSCTGGELVDAKNQEGRDEISFRKSVSKSSVSHKLPNPGSLLNLRKFCLDMLGILTNNNREISLCLLSQFKDREPIIREIASRSLAIRSLNNDSSQLASSSSPVNVVYHRENGQCVFDDPNDACGVVKWFRQTGTSWSRPIAANRKDDRWVGLPSALKSPFKHLIFCLDDAVGLSESLAKSHSEDRDHRWNGSTEERAAFGQWAFHIARHMFALCPVLANPNIYSAAAKAGLHLPIHSDPRHKTFVKVIQELSHRLERAQAAGTDSASQFTYLNDDQAWCVRQCIAYVAVGILEGSCSSDVIPLCDHRILRALGGLLFDLRRDDSAVLRLIVIEALARVLGAGILIERVQQAGYASTELFEDIVPALPAQLSQESRESLSIIYRILRCIPPFDEASDQNQTTWGSHTYDATDGHPRVRSLRDILLSYGEIVHMHAMFNLGDFDTTRFSRSHGLKSFGESNIQREVPSSSYAHEVPQTFEPFQWDRRFSETVISSARNSRMQQQRESSMSPLFSKPTKDIPAPVPDEVCSIPLIPVQPPIVQTMPTLVPSEGYSGVLRKIEEEEAQVFQTFNKRLYKSEVGISSQEARAAPLEKRATPFVSIRKELATSSPMVMQTDQEINVAPALRPSVVASPKKRPSAFIPKNEGASALFQKTEGFFEDALKSVRSETELGQNVASGRLSGPASTRKQCLDEELRFIISEHESGLHQVAQATSSLEEFVSSLKVATIPHVSRHVSEASANLKPVTVEDLEKFDLPAGALSLDNWHLVEGEISIRPRTPQQLPHPSPSSTTKQQLDETRLSNSVSQLKSDGHALMGRNSVPNSSARARYCVDADVIESQDPHISPKPVVETARSYDRVSRVEPAGLLSDSSPRPMKLSEDGSLVNSQPQKLKPASLSAASHPVLPLQSPDRANFPKNSSHRRHSLVLPEERSKEPSLNGNELPGFKNAAPLLRNRPGVPSPSPLQQTHQPVEETSNSSVSKQSAIPSAAVSKADQGSQSLPKTDSINASDGHFLDDERVHLMSRDLEALKWSQSVRNSVSSALPYQHFQSRNPSITIRPAVSPSTGLSATNIVGKTTSNSGAYASLKSSRSSQQGLLSRSRSSSVDRDASTFTRPVSPLISSRPNISLLGSSRPSLGIGVADRIEESTEQQHAKQTSMARQSESQSSTRSLQHSNSSRLDGSPSLTFKREYPSPAVKTELVEVRSQQQIPATFADVGTSAINFDEMQSVEFGENSHVTGDLKVSKLTPSIERLSVSSKRASSAPFGMNDGSFMNTGQKSGQATWLLRRTEIPNSPGSTPLMKSPSQRFPSHRTFSAGAAMPRGAKILLEHAKPVIPQDTMSEIHNLDESDGLMDLDELTPTKVNGTTVSVFKEAVNLDAFLARNGLQLGGQEDGRTEPSFVSNRIGPSDNLYDQSDLFGQSDFNLDASFGDLSVKLSNDVLNTEVQVPTHQSPVRDAFMEHRNVETGDSLGEPTPLRTAQAPNNRTPFTGMSIFADSSQMSNEPSGIPVTPGSPISFSWSAEGQESQLLGRLENASYELDDNDERQISRELAQKQESSEPRPLTHSSTLSFFKSNHSLGNLVSTQSTSMVRPRLRSALELVLRHLVFSQPGQKFGSSYWRENSIDYYELYSGGLVYGSLQHLASFPIAGASGDQRSSRRQELDDEVPVSEPLHGLLKSVFQLDISLMVDLCGPMTMSRNAAEAISERDNSVQLRKWLSGLTEVHRHLLPVSRAIRQVESELSEQLTQAQAMVVVKDQIELSRMTGGNVGLSIMEGLNAGARSSARTFIDWVSVLVKY
ncbi:hypothetical protein BJ741DRAFT_616548 [Chytriomyces cf. hyalinus JEL632]|nr:hypothetical protein BJ741DRAFT_616548 [Chytriomyces cf. hyalinus JEL632]